VKSLEEERERCRRETRQLAPWFVVALFFGWAILMTFLWIDAHDELAACTEHPGNVESTVEQQMEKADFQFPRGE
jgi:hypothetical protein